MSMTERREPADARTAPQAATTSIPHTNQTMAINPYPLTPAPPYGRHWGSLKQRLWTLDTDRVRPMATVVLDPAIPDERHALTSLQASVAVAFDRREVDEQHLAIVGGDPPVVLTIPVPTDGPLAPDAAQLGSADVQIAFHDVFIAHANTTSELQQRRDSRSVEER